MSGSNEWIIITKNFIFASYRSIISNIFPVVKETVMRLLLTSKEYTE